MHRAYFLLLYLYPCYRELLNDKYVIHSTVYLQSLLHTCRIFVRLLVYRTVRFIISEVLGGEVKNLGKGNEFSKPPRQILVSCYDYISIVRSA
jgi:hypothetical protein